MLDSICLNLYATYLNAEEIEVQFMTISDSQHVLSVWFNVTQPWSQRELTVAANTKEIAPWWYKGDEFLNRWTNYAYYYTPDTKMQWKEATDWMSESVCFNHIFNEIWSGQAFKMNIMTGWDNSYLHAIKSISQSEIQSLKLFSHTLLFALLAEWTVSAVYKGDNYSIWNPCYLLHRV